MLGVDVLVTADLRAYLLEVGWDERDVSAWESCTVTKCDSTVIGEQFRVGIDCALTLIKNTPHALRSQTPTGLHNTAKVNHSPSLVTDTPLDVRIKGGVVRVTKMIAGVGSAL